MGVNSSKSEDNEIQYAKKKQGSERSRCRDISKFKFKVHSDVSNMEEYLNYGLLPNQVIHYSFLFLPIADHLEVSLVSKLFQVVGNTTLFWKQYCFNYFGREFIEENKDEISNWKRFFFIKSRVKINSFYREKYFFHGWNGGKPPKVGDVISQKVVLLGRSGSGKTSIIERFVGNDFRDNITPTIGATFISHIFGPFKLGDERYLSILPMYYRSAGLIIIGFPLDSMDEYRKTCSTILSPFLVQGSEDYTEYRERILMVGTKSDLKREVEFEEVYQLVCQNDLIGYVECSAKDFVNICQLFGVISDYFSEKKD